MRFLIAGLFVLFSGPALFSQWVQIGWEPVVQGLTQPVLATGARDGSGRLFIVEQTGMVRIFRDGALVKRPFLDLTSRVQFDCELGLLSIAFPPQFAEKKHFYADFIDEDGNVVIARYKVTADPNVADPASEEILLKIPQPYGQHNGGMLAFSPVDGMLYISTGDGGIATNEDATYIDDPLNNGQNPGVLLGKILRIDTESGAVPYAIPGGNPQKPGWLPEIWSIGWRNPWRFSFDRRTADLYAGDVGADGYEEVNVEAAGKGGLNYGWSVREGTHCVPQKLCVDRDDLTAPALEYAHNLGCSVTGGVVYRGARFPDLSGTYFYADFCRTTVWAMRQIDEKWQSTSMGPSRALAVSFGEDDEGEVYLVDYRGSILGLRQIPPGLTITSTGNAASGEPGLVAGAMSSVSLSGLTDPDEQLSAEVYPLPMSLGGVTVSVNGAPMPLLSVAPEGRVDFLAPYRLPGESAEVTVRAGYKLSNVFSVPVKPVLPGLFSAAGGRIAAAVNEEGNKAVSAPRGAVLALFGTGLGPALDPPELGYPAMETPASVAKGEVTAMLGAKPAAVEFCSLTPGFTGMYTIIVRIANDAERGEGDVWIAVDGIRSRALRFTVE